MIILRDDARIARLRRIGRYTSLFGMLALIGGFVLVTLSWFGEDNLPLTLDQVLLYQLVLLTVGWLSSQVGLFLANRYVREPRADEVIDKAVGKFARNGRLYHYLLPAPHVLLTQNGIVVFNGKFQNGKISADGDKWTQKGIGMSRFFAQEALGNPTKEVENMVSAIAAYINKHAPSVEEVPIAPIIVFTTKNMEELELDGSRIPAVHHSKLKGYLRKQKGKMPSLSAADYEAIRQAFDQKAKHLLDAEGNPLAVQEA